MALSAKLQIRQSQSLVMTPQLMQSIRLLQFSHLELSAFIAREMEKNPLLELAEGVGSDLPGTVADGPPPEPTGETIGAELETSTAAIEENLGTSLENVFETSPGESPATPPLSDPWKSPSSSVSLDDGAAPDLDAWCAASVTLAEHLHGQAAFAFKDRIDALVAAEVIDSLDDDGYLRRETAEISSTLGISTDRVEGVIARIQTFDPAGVCARNLAECLAIQLAEKNRLDPAMKTLLGHLELLARRDFAELMRLCGVDREDMADMVQEIRELEPRPGSAFDRATVQAVAPDVIVTARPDGSWALELNPETLPRVLISRSYHATVAKACRNEADKTFLGECLQNANWLVRSLDQRAQTILKVASEIVKQQDMFLAHGVAHLRPLNLKTVADAIKMHESTVSRVTSNKYMMTPRGLFELKYFFTQAIASNSGAEAHSAEAVRHRIRQLVDGENARDVLSDDAIVEILKQSGIDIARRTVAKYRESMNIPSSVQRRREKLAFANPEAV
jgi:RNA polymerase sigma-54 factor